MITASPTGFVTRSPVGSVIGDQLDLLPGDPAALWLIKNGVLTESIGKSISELYPLVDQSLQSIISADGGATKRPDPEIFALGQASQLLNQREMIGNSDALIFYPDGTAQAVLDKALKYVKLGTGFSIPKLLAALNTPATDHHFYRYDNRHYYFLRGLGDGRYWAVDLYETANAGGHTIQSIKNAHICVPIKSVAQDSAGVSRVGANWYTASNQTASFGGKYYRTGTAGEYWEYTTPAGVTMVGHRAYHVSNAGIVLVTIDGDNTKADNLSTAQALVDAGTLAATALVANGGTLNPTDRVLDMSAAVTHDFYNGASVQSTDTHVMYAKNLTPGAHTIRVTCTGYKKAASTDVRLYAAGIIYFGPGVVAATTAGITSAVNGKPSGFYSLDRIGGASVWEYAVKPLPTGTTWNDWIGNGHGYESQVGDIILTVDGTPTAIPAEDAIISGSVIVATRTGQMFHPEVGAGATPISDTVVNYSLESLGLKISHSITWLVAGTQMGGYWHMYPFNGWATMGGNLGNQANSPASLTANDAAYKVSGQTNLAYVWSSTQNYVGALYSPTPANASGPVNLTDVITGNVCSIEDRAGGLINKIYLTRAGYDDEAAFAINDVWNFSALYQFAPLTDAHAVLTSI